MNDDVRSWLDTQLNAACAPERLPAGREPANYRSRVTQEIYPRLWRAGYPLPLNVVIDLAYIYLAGHDEEFPAKAEESANDDARSYRQQLNQGITRGPIRRAIAESQRALQRRNRLPKTQRADRTNGRQASLHDDAGAAMESLFTFMELVAARLLRNEAALDFAKEALSVGEPGVKVSNAVRAALLAGPIEPGAISGSGQTRNQDAIKFMQGFWKAIFDGSEKTEKVAHPFNQVFAEEANLLLTVTDARLSLGAEGLDLPVLQACLNYQPADLDGSQNNRYQHLRRTLSPRDSRTAKSPEFGNFGVTTRGNLNAILKSQLGRKDFVYNYYANRLLYFQRRTPQQEPYRALLAWVLDRGQTMQNRTMQSPNQRRDALARQTAAYLIEDAVRYFRDVPAIELHLIVLLHNGADLKRDYRSHPIAPPSMVLQEAPSINSRREADPGAWLPKVEGFLPYLFLREPAWPERRAPSSVSTSAYIDTSATPGDGAQTEAVVRSGGSLAFENLARIIGSGMRESAELGDLRAFDLCHVAIFEPSEAMVGQKVKEKPEVLRFIHKMAALTSSSRFVFDHEEVRFDTWPPVSTNGSGLAKRYDDREVNWNKDAPFRIEHWDYLMSRFEALR